jgi:hypothetical protein
VCPWLKDSDGIIARRFCELEVILGQVYAAIREKGAFKVGGEVRPLVESHRKLTQTQSMLATQLDSRRHHASPCKRTRETSTSTVRPPLGAHREGQGRNDPTQCVRQVQQKGHRHAGAVKLRALDFE